MAHGILIPSLVGFSALHRLIRYQERAKSSNKKELKLFNNKWLLAFRRILCVTLRSIFWHREIGAVVIGRYARDKQQACERPHGYV